MRYGGEDYYYWYRWDVKECAVGAIIHNMTKIDKGTGEKEHIGSFFVQYKQVPRGSAYNVGVNAKYVHMLNQPRA